MYEGLLTLLVRCTVQRCGLNDTCRALTRVTEECQSTIAELTRQKTDNVTLIARHLVNGNHLQSVSRLIVPAETLGLRKKLSLIHI